MTSPSRRNRQTTAPSTRTTKLGDSPVPAASGWVLCLAGLVLAATAGGTNADEPAGPTRIAAPVCYASGAGGTKLQWLPYRPSPEEITMRRPGQTASALPTPVRPVDYQQLAASAPSAAMQDPFGDHGVAMMLPEPPPPPSSASDSRKLPPLTIDPPGPVRPSPSDPRLGGEDASGAGTPNRLRELEPAIVPGTTPPPPMGQSWSNNLQIQTDTCPAEGEFKPISEITHDTRAKSGVFPHECELKNEPFQPRVWGATTYAWKASGLCHKPLYFEEVQLERYGHSWGPYLQPILSHGHFFATVPALPYLMGLNPPNECLYTLGYYRPGNCAPYMLDPLPISARAALLEAGAWTGAAFLVP